MKYEFKPKEMPDEVMTQQEFSHLTATQQKILANRGFTTVDSLENLLLHDFDKIVQNNLMKDSEVAAKILKDAIITGDHITIYRDYDCDGCCSGAIAMECLQAVGAKVSHYSNMQVVDGYGLCTQGIDKILKFHPETRVILTVDNGIVAHNGVDYAKSLGLIVIITDHHDVGSTLPNADAVVNPKREDEFCEFRDLCGAGVIFKLMLTLFQQMDRDILPVLNTLDLVALATVADVVPMKGENRSLVQEGVAMIQLGQRLFFRELLKLLKITNVSAHSELAFQVAPMVNACNRMGIDTKLVVETMLSSDETLVKANVSQLKEYNDNRKKMTVTAEEKIINSFAQGGANLNVVPVIMAISHDVSAGLVGLVAGRLKSRFNKVAAIFHATEDGLLKGSMRGVEGFHLKNALDKLPQGILIVYGGHEKAAGLTLKQENYEEFQKHFCNLVVEAFPNGPTEEERKIDLVLEEAECTPALLKEIGLLEPFGEGFPAPLLGLRATTISKSIFGVGGKHVRYETETGIKILRWNYGQEARLKKLPQKFVGTAQIKRYKGAESIEFLYDSP